MAVYLKLNDIASVETIDKKHMLNKRGAVSDDAIMTKLTKALQIQIGTVERYN